MISDAKILAADLIGKLISELEDEPELSAVQMKERFDAFCVLLKNRLNLLINELTTDYADKDYVDSAMTGSIDAITDVTAGSVTVDKTTFKIAVANVSGTYVFTYTSGAWKLSGNTVILSNYGIVLTGTPADNDTITVQLSFIAAENIMSKADYVDSGGTGKVLASVSADNGITTYSGIYEKQFRNVTWRSNRNGIHGSGCEHRIVNARRWDFRRINGRL